MKFNVKMAVMKFVKSTVPPSFTKFGQLRDIGLLLPEIIFA